MTSEITPVWRDEETEGSPIDDNRTLNEYLQEAFITPITMALEDGTIITVTPAQLLSKQIVAALVSGVINFANGKRIYISSSDFMNLVGIAFRQISPPVKPIEISEAGRVDSMSNEEVLRLYAQLLMEESDD